MRKIKEIVRFFFLRLFTGLIGLGASLGILFGFMTAGFGFVVFLVLAGLSLLGDWIVNVITDNKIEIWLGQTPFGIERTVPFESLSAQDVAWKILLGVQDEVGK